MDWSSLSSEDEGGGRLSVSILPECIPKELENVTEEEYADARDVVGRRLLQVMSQLSTETKLMGAGVEDHDGVKSNGHWRFAASLKNVEKVKNLYNGIHLRRAHLESNDSPLTLMERKKIMEDYVTLLETLTELECKVRRTGVKSKSKNDSEIFQKCTIQDTTEWTRRRFRRTDYFLMHQVWYRLEIIIGCIQQFSVSKLTESPDPADDNDNQPSQSSTSQDVILFGDHPSIAVSKLSLNENATLELVTSSEFSSLEDDPLARVRTRRRGRKPGKTIKSNSNRDAQSEFINKVSKILIPEDDMNYRNCDFGACTLDSNCNCYHCFPLNIPEGDEEDFEGDTDTIGVLWDIKGPCKTYEQIREEMTPKQRWEEERFNHILNNFENAILEAEQLTFGNMLWDVWLAIFAVFEKFWTFLKNRRARRVHPFMPSGSEMIENEEKLESRSRYSGSGNAKGDHVALTIERN